MRDPSVTSPFRDEDGHIIWCLAPGKTKKGHTLYCDRVTLHEGDHNNGTYRWPREDDE